MYTNAILPFLSSQKYALLYLVLSLAFSLIQLLNIFFFQKEYSKKINCTCEVNTIPVFLLNVIKIYIVQFLIFLVIFIAAIIPASLLLTITNETDINFMETPWFWIGTGVIIVFSLIWFYRLLFVANILVYKRSQYKSKVIIRESKYLIKKNLLPVCGSILLPLLLTIPMFFYLFKNSGTVKSYPLLTIIMTLIN